MDDRSRLTEQLEKVYVLLQDGSRRALAPTGLTPTQVTALRLLANAPRGGVSVSAVAQRMLCTRGNASRLITRLAAGGLVTTGATETDERLLLVRITTAGRNRLQAAEQALSAADAERYAQVAPDRLPGLLAEVERLAEGLEASLTDGRPASVAATGQPPA